VRNIRIESIAHTIECRYRFLFNHTQALPRLPWLDKPKCPNMDKAPGNNSVGPSLAEIKDVHCGIVAVINLETRHLAIFDIRV
jgi:hypothetical protein